MTKTALGALNDYKKQLDAAKMQLKKAKELMIVIEKLEVTLCMIPSRGDGAVVAAMKDPEGDNPLVANTKDASPNQVSIPQKSGWFLFSYVKKSKSIEFLVILQARRMMMTIKQ